MEALAMNPQTASDGICRDHVSFDDAPPEPLGVTAS
jgi:hypothetical protein